MIKKSVMTLVALMFGMTSHVHAFSLSTLNDNPATWDYKEQGKDLVTDEQIIIYKIDEKNKLRHSRAVDFYRDKYGTLTKLVPCPCVYDKGRNLYKKQIDDGTYLWSCAEYTDEGVCKHPTRTLGADASKNQNP